LRPYKKHPEFLFTSETPRPSFERDSNHSTVTVSHDPTRKQFFAKLLGAATAVTVAPKLLAKTASSNPTSAAPVAPVVVRSEVRAVARRAGSV
jgi:hypothetical protein